MIDVIKGKNVKIYDNSIVGFIPDKVSITKKALPKNYEPTRIGDNTIVYPHSIIYANVEIGKNCLICSNVIIREGCKIGNNTIIANGVTMNYNVHIGNKVKVMDNSHLTGNMIIEDNVFISTLVATTNDNTLGVGYLRIELPLPPCLHGRIYRRRPILLLSDGEAQGDPSFVPKTAIAW